MIELRNRISKILGVITAKIYPPADSTTALQVFKADGTTQVIDVDTTNTRLGVGKTPTTALDVNGTTTTTALTIGAKALGLSNSLTLAGTDSTTMTFPTTSASIARTDAANTFVGHQTIEGVTSTGATGTGKFVFDTSPSFSGHIGLNGAAANANYDIYNSANLTNTTGHYAVYNISTNSFNTSAAYYNIGLFSQLRHIIGSGVSDTGYSRAASFEVWRGYNTGGGDSGTLLDATCCKISGGQYSSDWASNPITTSWYSISTSVQIVRGTIGSYYGLMINAPATISTPALWAAATAYTTTTGIVRSAGTTTRYWACTTAGTSGGSEPTWDTNIGNTTADGGVVWTCIDIPSITTEYGVYVGSTTAKNYFAGNVGIGSTAPGTSATKVLVMGTGVAPTTTNPDTSQLYSYDQTGGNACIHARSEAGHIIKLYSQTLLEDLKVDYTTGDLDTEAEVIAAVNATNTRINNILTILKNNGLMLSA